MIICYKNAQKKYRKYKGIDVTGSNYFWSGVVALSQMTFNFIPINLWISFCHKHIFIFIIKNLVRH